MNKINANPRGIRIQRSIVNLLAAEHERRPTQMNWAGENEVKVSGLPILDWSVRESAIQNRKSHPPIIQPDYRRRKVEMDGAIAL
ncbi:MAG: hypothetical protein ACHRXM_31025 [Isosphaerales bacterium]